MNLVDALTRRRFLLLSLLFATCGMPVVLQAAPPPPFVHPGIWQTETDLERVRRHVKAHDEPWYSAWKALENSDAGKGTKVHPPAIVTNAYDIQNQGHSAYVLAVKWVASGDIEYAKASEGIIDAWTSTVTTPAHNTMRTGLGASQMANAAEILAYGFHGEAQWSPESIDRAKKWFKAEIYPELKVGASANWGTSTLGGIMSIGIFADDKEMFDYAVAAYEHGFIINGSLKDGCMSLTQYIDASGENAESGRDQAHSQGGVAHLVEVALAASNQGVDLVNYNDKYGVFKYKAPIPNRMQAGLEYMAKYNLGNDVPYHPFYEYCNNVTKYPTGPSDANGQRGRFSPMWEMSVYLMKKYHLSVPYSDQVVVKPGYRPEGTNGDHGGLGTLLYVTEPGPIVPKAAETSPKPAATR